MRRSTEFLTSLRAAVFASHAPPRPRGNRDWPARSSRDGVRIRLCDIVRPGATFIPPFFHLSSLALLRDLPRESCNLCGCYESNKHDVLSIIYSLRSSPNSSAASSPFASFFVARHCCATSTCVVGTPRHSNQHEILSGWGSTMHRKPSSHFTCISPSSPSHRTTPHSVLNVTQSVSSRLRRGCFPHFFSTIPHHVFRMNLRICGEPSQPTTLS